MTDLFIWGVIVGIVATTPFTVFHAYNRGYKDAEARIRNCPAIDLSLLASIPGFRIKGSGIDIDTTKMNDQVVMQTEMFDRFNLYVQSEGGGK